MVVQGPEVTTYPVKITFGEMRSQGVRDGRAVNRSEQYSNGTTWTLMPKTKDWYWRGTRGTSTMVGHLYHNERDGWMYTEELFEHGRLTMQSTADCHEAKEGD